jgi:Protein of unknown function (DUF3011)
MTDRHKEPSMIYRIILGIGLLFAVGPVIQLAQPKTVTCSSKDGERQTCPADASAGVALQRSLGPGECLLGKTWGYDGQSVWVSDGCSGEFEVGAAAQPTPTVQASTPKEEPHIETWGSIEAGKGFLVGRTELGELSISAFALTRYLDQLPAHQTFIDHLGVSHNIDPRDDIYSHRIMIFFKGWVGRPKLVYTIILWTVNTTDQKAIFAVAGYQFSKRFSLYGGLNGLPGTRSLVGSHPYWLANDRVMADEFFRPFFHERHLGQRRSHSGTMVPGHDRKQLERSWHYGCAVDAQFCSRRYGMVDAHYQRIRATRRLRRLGKP